MNAVSEAIPFKLEWPHADRRLLRRELPEPPALPLDDVLSPGWASWIRGAAASKGAPPDYVFAALLSVCGSLIGNTRWATPWDGWAEPPVIWSVIIGNPSAGKSPAIDAVLVPLKKAERALRDEAQEQIDAWKAKDEVAKLTASAWKEAVKAAIKAGEEPPAKPNGANPGPEPVMPRLAVSDATVEKLATILSGQPRGILSARDELAGWLQSMERYSGGGSDRPFWLEAHGGRSYSVERMGRASVYVERLSIAVAGGIQPDRLRSLLMKSDDDGLLARFLPVWPHPVPVKRPDRPHDEAFVQGVIDRLLSLEMHRDEDGHLRPWFIPFDEPAKALLDEFRVAVRQWETDAEGLLLSFIGKLPGMAVRLSLVIALMEWASNEAGTPANITVNHLGRTTHLIEAYVLPMARRAYADGSGSKDERSARALIALIREEDANTISPRDVRRRERRHLQDIKQVNAAIKLLESADLVRSVDMPVSRNGGAPKRLFSVNPIIMEASDEQMA